MMSSKFSLLRFLTRKAPYDSLRFKLLDMKWALRRRFRPDCRTRLTTATPSLPSGRWIADKTSGSEERNHRVGKNPIQSLNSDHSVREWINSNRGLALGRVPDPSRQKTRQRAVPHTILISSSRIPDLGPLTRASYDSPCLRRNELANRAGSKDSQVLSAIY